MSIDDNIFDLQDILKDKDGEALFDEIIDYIAEIEKDQMVASQRLNWLEEIKDFIREGIETKEQVAFMNGWIARDAHPKAKMHISYEDADGDEWYDTWKKLENDEES